MIEIRDARGDDDEAVAEVSRLATEDLRRVYRPSAGAARPEPAPPSGRLIAELDGAIVGTVRYRVEECRLHVIGLFVHPAARGQGVARHLLEALAHRAAEAGCDRLSLFTIRQTGNVPVFERLGFRVVGEGAATGAESVDGVSLTEAYMERTLQGKHIRCATA